MGCFSAYLKAFKQASLDADTLEDMAKLQHQMLESTFDKVLEAPMGFDRFESNITMDELIGAGTFGQVHRASRRHSDESYAVKIMDKIDGPLKGESAGEVMDCIATREMNAMRRVAGHPGIVTLHKAYPCKKDEQIYFVMELVEGENLWRVLSARHAPPREEDAVHVVRQLAEALAFCHSRGVAHRDMKPENVLVEDAQVDLVEEKDAQGNIIGWVTQEVLTVKLCDFGSAFVRGATAPCSKQVPVGTPGYAAPELMSCEDELSYDPFKVDAYSLGMLIFSMMCLTSPPAVSEGEGAHRKNQQWSALSPNAKSLVDALVVHNPLQRLPVTHVLKHPWVMLKA